MSCEVSDKSKNGSSKADHLNTRIPYGIRPVVKVRSYTLIVFQSTHPVWDATARATFPATSFLFQSTHPVWDATRSAVIEAISCGFQSTHPVWDATTGAKSATSVKSRFQSTHPVWDATTLISCPNNSTKFQSTHPVWDATNASSLSTLVICNFNPRIPYGMRLGPCHIPPPKRYFNPRIPYGMRLLILKPPLLRAFISIHASRMGCDSCDIHPTELGK